MTRKIASIPRGLVASIAGAALLVPAAGSGAGRIQKPTSHRAASINPKARNYYQSVWGVDGLKVTRVASGNLIRFTYRVVDPSPASVLNDKNATPQLYAPRVRAVLSVPTMEKVGPLRQTGALQAGQEYWMAFSNKGNLVKPGDRVNVIVGRFHVDGLVVQ